MVVRFGLPPLLLCNITKSQACKISHNLQQNLPYLQTVLCICFLMCPVPVLGLSLGTVMVHDLQYQAQRILVTFCQASSRRKKA